MTSEKIFTYDCSAHGAAGYGIEIYPETRINDSTCYVINFVRDGVLVKLDGPTPRNINRTPAR